MAATMMPAKISMEKSERPVISLSPLHGSTEEFIEILLGGMAATSLDLSQAGGVFSFL
jgi:hypothetical protein